MTAFTFHLSDGLAGRTDTVSGDEIETLDQVREAVAQAGSEAMRSLARSSIWGGGGGPGKMEARDSAGNTVCDLLIVLK